MQWTATPSRPAGMRALQQQAGQAEVTVVTTPQQLLDAVEEKATHIEIRAHLDLTTVTPLTRDSVLACATLPWLCTGAVMLNDKRTTTEDYGQSIKVCYRSLMQYWSTKFISVMPSYSFKCPLDSGVFSCAD